MSSQEQQEELLQDAAATLTDCAAVQLKNFNFKSYCWLPFCLVHHVNMVIYTISNLQIENLTNAVVNYINYIPVLTL